MTSCEVSLTALLEKFCNEPGPPSLVIRAEASAIISVEVFVEKNQIAPMRIALKLVDTSRYRALAVFSAQENVAKPFGDFAGNLPEVSLIV